MAGDGEVEEVVSKIEEVSLILNNIIQGGRMKRFLFTEFEQESLRYALKFMNESLTSEDDE